VQSKTWIYNRRFTYTYDEEDRLKVYQNYPNPVKDQTTITLYVPKKDHVKIIISDIPGREIIQLKMTLEHGFHSFIYAPEGGDLSFFTAFGENNISSIKILHTETNKHQAGSLSYIGVETLEPTNRDMKAVHEFPYALGDEMLYIGYAGPLQSGILDNLETSEIFTFQFAYKMPCLGTPTVTYEGQVYYTVQIFSQCWLKQNLNIGTMIDSLEDMQDNGIIEKYCYENNQDSCNKYGGLYQWGEMMQYSSELIAQGICPPGWHVSTDEEWKVLEGAADSLYGIGDPEWDEDDWRGYDAGINIKTRNGWPYGAIGTNLVGFSGLPGGVREDYAEFNGAFEYGYYWTSAEFDADNAICRGNCWHCHTLARGELVKEFGFSVRCIKDD